MNTMTTLNKDFESVIAYLENLSIIDLVNIHNTFCQECSYGDDEIYENDEEFFSTHFEGRMLDAVRAISYGDYNYNHGYVWFNGYANLDSSDFPDERIDTQLIANDILENPERYDIELEDNED